MSDIFDEEDLEIFGEDPDEDVVAVNDQENITDARKRLEKMLEERRLLRELDDFDGFTDE